VILISQHDRRGSIGFILNKPTHLRIMKRWKIFLNSMPGVLGRFQSITNPFFTVHKLGDKLPGSVEIIKGIYWGGDYKTPKLLVDNGEVDPEDIRFVAGYSAWNPGKTGAGKSTRKTGVVTEADKQKIFDEKPDEAWGKHPEGNGTRIRCHE
jgi:putative transcriptional regulator